MSITKVKLLNKRLRLIRLILSRIIELDDTNSLQVNISSSNSPYTSAKAYGFKPIRTLSKDYLESNVKDTDMYIHLVLGSTKLYTDAVPGFPNYKLYVSFKFNEDNFVTYSIYKHYINRINTLITATDKKLSTLYKNVQLFVKSELINTIMKNYKHTSNNNRLKEVQKGTIEVSDERKAQELSKKGYNVKLTKKPSSTTSSTSTSSNSNLFEMITPSQLRIGDRYTIKGRTKYGDNAFGVAEYLSCDTSAYPIRYLFAWIDKPNNYKGIDDEFYVFEDDLGKIVWPELSNDTSVHQYGDEKFMQMKNDNGGIDTIHLNEAKKKKNKLKGGKGDKLTADDVNPYELRKGIREELEHTNDLDEAEEIALDHLAEDPLYYTNLAAAVKLIKSRKDLPKEIKNLKLNSPSKSMVDKDNATKVVKKDSKKQNAGEKLNKKEAVKSSPKGVKEMPVKPKKAKGIKGSFKTPGKETKKKLGLNETKLVSDIRNTVNSWNLK